jgi:signal transduction histidine kinase
VSQSSTAGGDARQVRGTIPAGGGEGEPTRALVDELREALAAKSEFLSRVTHELRTPLSAIIGFSDLLSLTDLNTQQCEWLEMIQRSSAHLLELISDVLDLSRAEAGQLFMSRESVAVRAVVDEAVEMMRPLAASRGIAVTIASTPDDRCTVVADRHRLLQVLINLLSNAIKYNRDRGQVRVTVEATRRDRVRIIVADTGHGIDSAGLRRLCTPFERLGAASSGIEGTGLGLALSRDLIDAMGGGFRISSEPGAGTQVRIDLPAPSVGARTPADQLVDVSTA